MKKIVAILALNLVFFNTFSITINEVESVHTSESKYIAQAITALTTSLMDLETNAWLNNLKKKDFTYPKSILTQSEVSSLLAAINDLESGKGLETRYRSGLSGNLLVIFSQIRDDALAVNRMPFKRGQVKWFKGQWKPIVLNFFKHAKALIKSFGPQAQKQAHNMPQHEGYSSRYFPEPKSGASMRVF